MKHPEHEIRSGVLIRPVLHDRSAPPPATGQSHPSKWLLLLLTLVALNLLGGCASINKQEFAGQGLTGYPEDVESRIHF